MVQAKNIMQVNKIVDILTFHFKQDPLYSTPLVLYFDYHEEHSG